MPIVASTGGIAGTQSLAVSVRALATRDLTASNARRVVLRELGAGLLNGLALAADPGRRRGMLIFGDPWLGAGAGAGDDRATRSSRPWAGVLVPLGLNRLGLDPALASGTFVTTLTDVMGYLRLPRLGHDDAAMTAGDIKAEARRAAFAARKTAFAAGQGQAAELLADCPARRRRAGCCRATCRCGPRSTRCPRWPRIRGRSACR